MMEHDHGRILVRTARTLGMDSHAFAPIARRLYWLYQGVLAGLALSVIWLFSQPDEPWVQQANVAIWAVFCLDYVVRFALSHHKGRFVRGNIPELIAALPLDLLSGQDIFELGRLTRLAQLARLLRATTLLWRLNSNLRAILTTNGLGNVLVVVVTIIILGGLIIWQVEPEISSIGDGLWWSIVTATTVGYGDISPKTVAGRVVAASLMIVGISTFGLLTGAITTHFMRRPKETNPHIATIVAQLERWDELSPAERRQVADVVRVLAEPRDDGDRRAAAGAPAAYTGPDLPRSP